MWKWGRHKQYYDIIIEIEFINSYSYKQDESMWYS